MIVLYETLSLALIRMTKVFYLVFLITRKVTNLLPQPQTDLLVFVWVVFAGPGESPHVVDCVGPRHSHHLCPPVEEEVALLVVSAGLSVRVVWELCPGQTSWTIFDKTSTTTEAKILSSFWHSQLPTHTLTLSDRWHSPPPLLCIFDIVLNLAAGCRPSPPPAPPTSVIPLIGT